VTVRRFQWGQRVDQLQGGRFYLWDRQKYWSVTSIIGGGLPKPALINWAKKFTAEYAVEHADAFATLVADDPKGAVQWLKDAAYRDRDRKGEIGSNVHEAAEAYALGKPYPEWGDDEAPVMGSFVQWLDEWRPKFMAVEAPVFSRSQKYAGTLDAVAEFDFPGQGFGLNWGVEEDRPIRLLIDYKTGKAIYPETALQLAAYRYAETFFGLPDSSETSMPEVDGCAALLLRPRGYHFIPVRADEAVFRAFLYIREVFRFQEELAKVVVGADLPVPKPVQPPADAPVRVGEP